MKDTAPEINAMMFQRTMALSESARFLMGLSMMQTAREMVWASLADTVDETTKRKMFFRRMYGMPLPEAVATYRRAR